MQDNTEFALNVALNKITGAWDEQMLAELLDKIKGFFSGCKLEFPKIKLPHFSLEATPYLYVRNIDIGSLGETKQMQLFHAVEIDFENNFLYALSFADSAVTVENFRIPMKNRLKL